VNRRTIGEVRAATGVSRFTLSQTARQGRFGKAAHREGRNWIIDIDHPDYHLWLTAHAYQPRVKGRKS
jgi:hypothetical protein